MKSFTFTIVIAAIFLISGVANQAFADTSETHITTTSSRCQTSVHMETNGQAQDYNSSNCGDNVHLQSGNGNSTVNITNDVNSNITITPPPLPTTPPLPTVPPLPTISITPPDISLTIAAEKQKIKEKSDKAKAENLLRKIEDIIKNFFSNFHF